MSLTIRSDGLIPRRVIRLSPLARYGIAVAAPGAATLLRLALDPVWGLKLPFILFYPAIVVSAWFGGLWPGIHTTMLSAVAADYFWMTPCCPARGRDGTATASASLRGGAYGHLAVDDWQRESEMVHRA